MYTDGWEGEYANLFSYGWMTSPFVSSTMGISSKTPVSFAHTKTPKHEVNDILQPDQVKWWSKQLLIWKVNTGKIAQFEK